MPPPVGQVRLRSSAGDARAASYADLRGATSCDLIGREQRDAIVARLGPDPLRARRRPGAGLAADLAAATRPIGDLLMDQEVLAGVGNVYRAEVLFRHRLHPLRPGSDAARAASSGRCGTTWSS